MAEQTIEQEAALRVGGFDAELLDEVEHALKKLDDGSYGISEDSGAPIPLERLDALPWARRTAQEEDRRESRASSRDEALKRDIGPRAPC